MKFSSSMLGPPLLAASALISLSGCMVLPLAGAKLMQPAPQTITVSGPKFPDALFRESAIKTGGVVTESSSQYARSEFRASSVRIELQQVKQGEYQLIGSSIGTWRSIDRAAIERMRSERLQAMDAVTRRITLTMADVADILTPAQRKKFAERMQQRRGGWHRG